MRFLSLFLFTLPFILLEATFFLFPVTLIIIFSVALISTSPNRFIFAFASGFLFDLLSGTDLYNSLYFLLITFIIGFYVQFFPKNYLLNVGLLIIFEIIFFLINNIPILPGLLIAGIFIFIPAYLLIYKLLMKDEETQLKFEFIKI